VELALSVLQKTANPWVESSVHLAGSALSFFSGELDASLAHAEQALALSRTSGSHYNELASLANACQVCVVLGRFDQAFRYLSLAEPLASEVPLLKFCLHDTKAQLQLATDDLTGCESTLDSLVNAVVDDAEGAGAFPALESLATQIRLLQRQRYLDKAQMVAEEAASVARSRGERVLETAFRLRRAEILTDLDRVEDAKAIARQAMTAANQPGVDSLRTRAELEHVRGKILHSIGASRDAISFLERSVRIHAAIGQLVARDGASETIDRARAAAAAGDDPVDNPLRRGAEEAPLSKVDLIESLASLGAFAGRPDLLGSEICALIMALGIAEQLALLTLQGSTKTLVQEHNWPDAVEHDGGDDVTVLSLGILKDIEFVLQIKPKAHFLASSRLAGLQTLLRMVIANEEARQEKLRHESVWPREAPSEHGSQRMRDLYREAMKVARSNLTILLTGETGVGKEVLAREIHKLSTRSQRDFRPVVCAGVPHGLLESHLFGHRRGSFTGAASDFQGVIRGAEGGTLFLDEIGDLATELQIKLLRFLDSKEIHPVGELKPFLVNIRIIAATNANLQQLVADGKFREDLLYRLNMATFNIPPLRERREEIPSLVQHYLAHYSQENQKPVPTVSDDALEHLLLHSWPGNIRELRNEMERLAGVVDAGGTIRRRDLKPEIVSSRRTGVAGPGPTEVSIRVDQSLPDAMEQLEREMIRRALLAFPDNQNGAAASLGITRKGLFDKRRRLGLP
jgi:DNA-binding NtrC family response regulator